MVHKPAKQWAGGGGREPVTRYRYLARCRADPPKNKIEILKKRKIKKNMLQGDCPK